MHNSLELNVDTHVSVRPGANGKVQLVFLGSQDDSSLVITAYPAQAQTLLDGLKATTIDADDDPEDDDVDKA